MFGGLMPAMVTPLRRAGEMDLAATEVVIERFIEAGVNGISPRVVPAKLHTSQPTSEALRRGGHEDRRWPRAGRDRGRLQRHAGDRRARQPRAAGADAVLVVSPFYWKVGEEGLFRHFATVAEAVDIPVVVYNLPMLTGIDLSPSLVARIAAECPNVVGLKDTVTEYLHTVAVLREIKPSRPDFSVLSGWEDLILPSSSPEPTAPSVLSRTSPPSSSSTWSRQKRPDEGGRAAPAGTHPRDTGRYSDPPIGAIKVAEEARRSHLPYRPRPRSASDRRGRRRVGARSARADDRVEVASRNG